MKDVLIFDVTDATSIAASDSVGAYLRASDGTLLTHTDVSGKKALDVRVAEGINVEVDLAAADDSVAAWTNDGAGNPIGSTGGALHISDAGGSLTIDAVDLDIRDLVFATDKVDVSGSEVSLDAATLAALESITVQNGAGAAAVNIQDGGNSITVDAIDLDIRDLTQADEITVFQGTSPWVIGDGGGSITVDGAVSVTQTTSPWVVSDAALAATAIAHAAETLDVASTAQDVVASPLANRKYLWVYNNDNNKMFIGASGVTEATGFPISPGSYMEMRIGAAVDIEFVSAKVNHAIRTLEAS